MATAFISISAAPRAIPTPQPIRPANDNTSSRWTDDSRAQLLLASCVANPPAGEWKRTRYVQTADTWFEYVGYRAEALDAIRMAHGDRALASYHAIGDVAYPPFAAWCAEPNVTDAIDAALSSSLNLARKG